MVDFLIYPAIDGDHSFPPEVRQAMADALEFANRYATKVEVAELPSGGSEPEVVAPEVSGFPNATGYGFTAVTPDEQHALFIFGEETNYNGAGYFRISASNYSGEAYIRIGNHSPGHTGRLWVQATEEILTETPSYTVTCDLGDGPSSVLSLSTGYVEVAAYGVSKSSKLTLTENAAIITAPYFMPPKCTTALRPTGLSTGNKGAMVFDTTINLPIVWSGTAWTNFVGAAV